MMNKELANYNRDKAALANPESAKQVMEIADRYKGLHKALKGWKGREEEYYKSFEMMIEALRIIGVGLQGLEKDNKGGDRFTVTDGNREIIHLADFGITKRQSMESQNLAKIPLTVIEEYINSRRLESDTPTMAALQEIAKRYKTADEVCKEELEKTIASLRGFCVNAKHTIDHLNEFPDSRRVATEETFKALETLKEIIDQLERHLM